MCHLLKHENKPKTLGNPYLTWWRQISAIQISHQAAQFTCMHNMSLGVSEFYMPSHLCSSHYYILHYHKGHSRVMPLKWITKLLFIVWIKTQTYLFFFIRAQCETSLNYYSLENYNKNLLLQIKQEKSAGRSTLTWDRILPISFVEWPDFLAEYYCQFSKYHSRIYTSYPEWG